MVEDIEAGDITSLAGVTQPGSAEKSHAFNHQSPAWYIHGVYPVTYMAYILYLCANTLLNQ